MKNINYTYPRKYAGSDWLKRQGVPVSALGEKAANLIGDLYQGIYHLPESLLFGVDWLDDTQIEVPLSGELATNDFNLMTRLVFLAHYHNVRVSIEPMSPTHMKMRINNLSSLAKKFKSVDEHMDIFCTIDWEASLER